MYSETLDRDLGRLQFDPLLLTWISLIPTWISKYTNNDVRDEVTYLSARYVSLPALGVTLLVQDNFPSILLTKLHHYGIRGQALNWFKSYLENRKQFVSYNNVRSTCIVGCPKAPY